MRMRIGMRSRGVPACSSGLMSSSASERLRLRNPPGEEPAAFGAFATALGASSRSRASSRCASSASSTAASLSSCACHAVFLRSAVWPLGAGCRRCAAGREGRAAAAGASATRAHAR